MYPHTKFTLQPRKSIRPVGSGAVNDPGRIPPSLPVPAALQTWGFWRSPHAYLDLCHKRYGNPFTINALGKSPMIFISDPNEIASILSASPDLLHPGAGASVIKPLVGEQSFMLLEEPEHMTVRKAIMPAYHATAIAKHATMVREIAEKEIDSWPADRMFAAHPRLRSLALKVILASIFGSDDHQIGDLHARLLEMLAVTDSLVLQEPHLRFAPRWRGIWRSFLLDRTNVGELLRQMIEDQVHAADRETGVLALLLGEHRGDQYAMSVSEVSAHLMSLVLAGHETTSSQLAWALQLLAHNPVALATLTDDIDQGSNVYLTATVQEVLRDRPVFLFTIPRVLAAPIEVAGRHYQPPGQLVGCIHLMHHDPDIYRKPHCFRPERFVDSPPRPDTWRPWGGGRKRCPGHSLATLEMQTVLRETLTRWSVRPGGETVETARWRSVIVTPEHGCQIILHRRPRHAATQNADSDVP
jgi:cytochrome P450